MSITRTFAPAAPFLLAAVLAVTACGSSPNAETNTSTSTTGTSTSTTGTSTNASPNTASTTQLTLYTSVTQNTITAVLDGFEKANPTIKVNVFRATTGQLNARIAADEHSGGLRADVIWGTDPLSMESYAQEGLFQPWPLPNLTGVPSQDKTKYFWGTRELYLVIVAHKGLAPMPTTWSDLSSASYRGKVALPDPAAAGSAFAALGYFDTTAGFGMNYYHALKADGAVQVSTIPEVVTDVAEGRYQLGITLDSEVRAAIKQGSPVVLVWPSDGAISLYSPIAETTAAHGPTSQAAQALLRYVLSTEGQTAIGKTGWQPVLPGIPGPARPAGATEVYPAWTALFGRQNQVLQQYQAIFGA
jgi:iron(III) transport system substrate-binding protein